MTRAGAVTRGERVLAGVFAAALLGLLVVASTLTPSHAGHGTHEQLGLPACGFYLSTGTPCPTCGMTTAFAHVAHRQPVRGFLTQPFGAMIAFVASIAFWGCLHVAALGSRLGRVAGRLVGRHVVWTAAAALLASWVYTIATWKP